MTTHQYREFRELLRQKAFSEATALAERMVLATGEQNGFWWTQLSLSMAGAGKHSQALDAADRALELQPGNGFALRARANTLRQAGRFEEALSSYEEAVADPRMRQRCRWGMFECLRRLKKWERILQLLSDWSMTEDDARPWRTAALAGLGRTQEAITECRNWLTESPDHPRALWLLIDLEIRLEGLENVRRRIGRLARIPSRPTVYGEIYASLCRRAGKSTDASRQYAKLADRTGDPYLRRKQAFAQAKSGQEKKAIPTMEELLRTAPKDMYVHKAYAAACRRVDELDRALAFYDELLELHPEEKTLHGRKRNVCKMKEAQ